jgi:hypothetical protein
MRLLRFEEMLEVCRTLVKAGRGMPSKHAIVARFSGLCLDPAERVEVAEAMLRNYERVQCLPRGAAAADCRASPDEYLLRARELVFKGERFAEGKCQSPPW